jgi:hypothetical protein
MIGRVVGAVLGTAITRGRKTDPIAGAAIGAAAMYVARRFLPARLVVVGGTIAAAIATKHLSDMAERRAARGGTATSAPAPSRRARIAGAPAKVAKRVARTAATTPRAPAIRRAQAAKSPPANP